MKNWITALLLGLLTTSSAVAAELQIIPGPAADVVTLTPEEVRAVESRMRSSARPGPVLSARELAEVENLMREVSKGPGQTLAPSVTPTAQVQSMARGVLPKVSGKALAAGKAVGSVLPVVGFLFAVQELVETGKEILETLTPDLGFLHIGPVTTDVLLDRTKKFFDSKTMEIQSHQSPSDLGKIRNEDAGTEGESESGAKPQEKESDPKPDSIPELEREYLRVAGQVNILAGFVEKWLQITEKAGKQLTIQIVPSSADWQDIRRADPAVQVVPEDEGRGIRIVLGTLSPEILRQVPVLIDRFLHGRLIYDPAPMPLDRGSVLRFELYRQETTGGEPPSLSPLQLSGTYAIHFERMPRQSGFQFRFVMSSHPNAPVDRAGLRQALFDALFYSFPQNRIPYRQLRASGSSPQSRAGDLVATHIQLARAHSMNTVSTMSSHERSELQSIIQNLTARLRRLIGRISEEPSEIVSSLLGLSISGLDAQARFRGSRSPVEQSRLRNALRDALVAQRGAPDEKLERSTRANVERLHEEEMADFRIPGAISLHTAHPTWFAVPIDAQGQWWAIYHVVDHHFMELEEADSLWQALTRLALRAPQGLDSSSPTVFRIHSGVGQFVDLIHSSAETGYRVRSWTGETSHFVPSAYQAWGLLRLHARQHLPGVNLPAAEDALFRISPLYPAEVSERQRLIRYYMERISSNRFFTQRQPGIASTLREKWLEVDQDPELILEPGDLDFFIERLSLWFMLETSAIILYASPSGRPEARDVDQRLEACREILARTTLRIRAGQVSDPEEDEALLHIRGEANEMYGLLYTIVRAIKMLKKIQFDVSFVRALEEFRQTGDVIAQTPDSSHPTDMVLAVDGLHSGTIPGEVARRWLDIILGSVE